MLPWSFLEAEYAQKIRKWFAERFGEIEVLVLQGAHFKDTVKRVLLVWLRNYGDQSQSMKIGFAEKCDSKPDFQHLSLKVWDSKNALIGLHPETNSILNKLKARGFQPLEKYADVSIGVVTGANKYFILPRQTAKEKGFSGKSVLRIITSVEDLERVAGAQEMDKVLIQFDKMTKRRRDYVRYGEELGVHNRVHCTRRKKHFGSWFDINTDPLPDAFFTYRVSSIPYLFKNPDGYQCTNSLHKIIFKEVSENERKWIELSLLSLFGQLSLEMRGRHYGNGIIKIEPTTLKKSLVYAIDKPIKNKTYNDIMKSLYSGNKEKACLAATNIIAKELNIEKSYIEKILTSVNAIRKLRGASLIKKN